MTIIHNSERFTPEQFIDYVNTLAHYDQCDYDERPIQTIGEAIQYINQFN